jgi:phage N-6-adenine-methyltransferase
VTLADKHAVHYSSASNEWETPQALFDQLDAEFHFTLDPCATPENAKCHKFFTKQDDGLCKNWYENTVFVNPPYGREIGAWVAKSLASAKHGATVVMLIPARTDTKYWHEFVMEAHEIRFIRGRVKFGGVENNAPFPGVIVVFRSWLVRPIIKRQVSSYTLP